MSATHTAALVVTIIGLLGGGAAAEVNPVIVLDPGHGGTNTGAFGKPTGRHEKHLTLQAARATADQLAKLLPNARCILTRSSDSYLTLDQRVRIANSADATLFVSLHFNASKSRTQRGFETYVLSHDASDREAERLARRENAQRRPAVESDSVESDGDVVVARILADLGQRAAHARSLQLATAIQRSLARARPRAANRGVRQAPFDVLLGLRMPGALVELGFIDHPDEGVQIVQPDAQQRVATALARAIAAFVKQTPGALTASR